MIIDERDEGGKSKDNKRVKSKQHCSGREKTGSRKGFTKEGDLSGACGVCLFVPVSYCLLK